MIAISDGLASIVERQALQGGRRIALHFEGRNFSYGEIWQSILATQAKLVAWGVQPGDRVAYLGLNHPSMLVLLFALARLGGILVPLNYRLAEPELADILSHAGAALVLSDEAHQTAAGRLAAGGAAKSLAITSLVSLGCTETETAPLASGADTAVEQTAIASDASSPVLLVYTSGTTGRPKGALHTQAGLLANCAISRAVHGFTSTDHVLTVLPMFHVGGLCIQTLPALHAGAKVTLHARFDAGSWLEDVTRLRPTTALMVPATMRAVLDHPDFATADLSSLRQLVAGSSQVPVSLIAAFHARHVPVGQIYGATETGPVSICLSGDAAMLQVGSTGKPARRVDVRLVDDAGQGVAAGEVGEIWIRAPNVMQGYWRDPGNPAFQGGWFHTGDLARCDANGFYWVVGRSKDIIISGGENIYPAEIENLLVDCPQVQEAAAVGLPHARWGEVVVAVVVPRPGARLDEAMVLQWLDGKLARFKLPRQVIFTESLPKTALGKVQKNGLLDLLDLGKRGKL